ncbi:MAG: hypothetical protein UY70_C0004G0001 [Candidatus Kaiserbacteria bacterium GW2011_GWB1_52_6]|uniref:Uncharacterized protein n=2 Tax=Candidatus Kaiseribacteriota TaxID=1752734 RepID=A0A0G1ZJ27_9BACT|nr:MAG: hypothetical protein UY67_C0020G0001 [Candidatus Kaiserbacteria bacterium GW2011_GWA2_52_12]KKW28017.1 MAG: hypothetical protein UY70_C0004G0001 [Candidatus Kaiserbacteria bacterium GW2011_GWB1_52_6]
METGMTGNATPRYRGTVAGSDFAFDPPRQLVMVLDPRHRAHKKRIRVGSVSEETGSLRTHESVEFEIKEVVEDGFRKWIANEVRTLG